LWKHRYRNQGATHEGKTILTLICFAHFVNDLYMMVLPPLLPVLMVVFGLNYFISGLLVSLVLLISFIAGLGAGYIADAGNYRKAVLLSGFLLNSLSILLLYLASDFYHIVLVCIIMGVAQGTYHPQSISFINFLFKRGKGRATGIHGVGGNLGHFAAPMVVTFLVTLMGWGQSLILLLVPPILMTIVLWRMLEEPAVPSTKGFIKSITLPLVLLTLISSLRDMVYRGFASFLPSYFVAEGSTLLSAGMLTASMIASGVVAQPLGGSLSDKIGRKKIFTITLLLLTFSLLGFTMSKGMAKLAFLPLIGFGIFATFPVSLIYASELGEPGATGTSVGFLYGTSQVIASASPILMGYLIDEWGFTASFFSLTIFAGLAFVASNIIPRRGQEQ